MKNTLLIIVSAFAIYSCSNTEKKTEKEEKKSTEEKMEHEHTEAEPIQLNEGKKWKVNDSMLVYIRKMESDFMVFVAEGSSDVNVFADSLQKNIDLLTSNCTMKGAAHDELHKWLVPYMELVGQLKTKAAGEKEKLIFELQKSFKTFNSYFE